MPRSNLVPALLLAALVIAGLLALPLRPTLPPDGARGAGASAQHAAEPSYPPASIDGRPEPDRSAMSVELCGYGPFEARPGELYPAHLTASADLALAQAIGALADGGDPRQRAGALYQRAARAAARAREGHVAQNPDCMRQPACRAQAGDAAAQAFARDREPLITEALATRDPAAYALAVYACVGRPQDAGDSGACKLVSAAQWAQLDPANLMAWAHAAWEAQRNGDTAARAEALRRAAQATESRRRSEVVLEPANQLGVRSLDRATRTIALAQAFAVEAAVPVPGMALLREECAGRAAMDDARRELCGQVGHVLAGRGSTLPELSLGIAIGERAGWADEELRALRERRDAYQFALNGASPAPWSCEYQQQAERGMAASLAGRELAMAEEQVKASGRSAAELAQQWRARFTQRPK